jgi:hypothetical protein
MTGPWKGGKSKSSFPHLPTAPWKSGPTGQDSHIPVSRLLLRKQKREQKQQTLTDDQSVNHAPGLNCQLSPRLYIHAVPSGLHRPPGEISGLAAMVFGECFRCCPCGASLQAPVDRA